MKPKSAFWFDSFKMRKLFLINTNVLKTNNEEKKKLVTFPLYAPSMSVSYELLFIYILVYNNCMSLSLLLWRSSTYLLCFHSNTNRWRWRAPSCFVFSMCTNIWIEWHVSSLKNNVMETEPYIQSLCNFQIILLMLQTVCNRHLTSESLR